MPISSKQARFLLLQLKKGTRFAGKAMTHDRKVGAIGGAVTLGLVAPIAASMDSRRHERIHETARKYAMRRGGSDIGPYRSVKGDQGEGKRIGRLAAGGAASGAVLGAIFGHKAVLGVAGSMLSTAGKAVMLPHRVRFR